MPKGTRMLVYSFLMFPVLLLFALCYYPLSFCVMFPVGFCVVILGILGNVDWYIYDTDIIRNCHNKLLRFFLSFWTNRREPMPSGGKRYLWLGKPELYRYIRWHIRNPLSDLGMYYLGIANREYRKIDILKNRYIEINLKKIKECPFYFPRYSFNLLFGFNFSLGWKKRGCFGVHLKQIKPKEAK